MKLMNTKYLLIAACVGVLAFAVDAAFDGEISIVLLSVACVINVLAHGLLRGANKPARLSEIERP